MQALQGFLARPIGGIIFAHFGEIFGRKWALVVTLALMGTATFLIGCIPSYETIGILSSILLFLLRLLQGLELVLNSRVQQHCSLRRLVLVEEED